tara:strand:+ start:5498 stop:5815 length:318 start_codon:yes stop_codon:yes gene_type:complete
MPRLTIKQARELDDIMDYIAKPRPELEWMGTKAESRYLSHKQWQVKLGTFLYVIYNDMYPTKLINRQAVEDYFDDEYMDELTSISKRLKKFFKNCFSSTKYYTSF